MRQKNIMANLHDTLENVQAASTFTPNSVMFKAKSTADELKSRLEWGGALTIVDVRDPETFNREHITGAISVPFERLEDLARSALNRHRDIYIYGESDKQSLAAAQTLQGNGFTNVAQIIGGLAAWHKVAGSTEG
jgi:rhodanese-related sulfurtransferase